MRDKPIFSSGRILHKNYYRKSSVEKNDVVVSLKGLDAKINWLAVNRQPQGNADFDFDDIQSPSEREEKTVRCSAQSERPHWKAEPSSRRRGDPVA
jgi:hypothetical protein